MSDINDITDEEIYRAAFNKSEDECDRLRAENARLEATVKMWQEANDDGGGGWIDRLRTDLQRHKSALEKARETLELARHCWIRLNAKSLNELQTMPTPYDETISDISKVLK